MRTRGSNPERLSVGPASVWCGPRDPCTFRPQARAASGARSECPAHEREPNKCTPQAGLRDLDAGTLADGRQPLEAYLSSEWLPKVARVSKRGRPLAPTTAQRYRDACRHVSGI